MLTEALSHEATQNVRRQMNGHNKMWYIHTMKYYSAVVKKEILSYATMWMYLKDVTLNKIC